MRRQRRENREIRSYEATHVGALWHLDFHHGSLKVLTASGQWLRPIALGILDDHSRLCCHVQWYVSETAEDLVHGLSQAIQKRGLPRALLTDNGSAMVAEEVAEGLLRLGIVHERTLPYSPYQNGKQEAFWGTLEGRLLKMLDGVAELTLELLNEATQAWMEIEYNRAVHRETSSSPVERFDRAPDVLRLSPSSESLRDAFRLETKRSQRQSDGTISLEGVRFEIPARYRHFREVTVRYARWDLGRVDLVDERSGIILAPIYPLDRSANADGRRAVIEPGGTAGPPENRRAHRWRAAAPSEKHPARVLGHWHATGVLAQDTSFRERRRIMNSKKLLAQWGLKWNPFSPELPSDGLLATAKIEHFAWRVEQLVQEGGFALITGESGTGKSVALRIVAQRLSALRDVIVGVIERPQSKSSDFYRELGDIFAVKLKPSNRWGGFKAPARALENPRGLVTDPSGTLSRRSTGDEPRRPRRAADSLQCRLRCHLALDGGPLGRRETLGTPAAGRPRTLGDPDPHATCDRGRLARGALGAAPPRPLESRQCDAHDGRTHGCAGRSQRRQLPAAHDHQRGALGLRHGERRRAA